MSRSAKFETKKSLGQHFLTSAVIPTHMCTAAAVTAADTILEIGPGTGALTKTLLATGAHVIALEADERALIVLQETFADELASGHLTLHHMDVRSHPLADIPGLHDHQFKVVANIPYYLSGLLFRTVLEGDIQPTTVVFLVQKEVAKRAVATIDRGEKESLLSLSIQAYGTPRYVMTVKRGHFNPPPKVDSAIIAITDIDRTHLEGVDSDFFFELLHLGFGQKRKQLLTNLATLFDRPTLVHTFSTLDIPETIRAEDLSFKKWRALVQALRAHK